MTRKRPLEILFITWNYPPKLGGMETMLSQLVANLHSHDCIRLIGPYDPDYEHQQNESIIRPSRDGLLRFLLTALARGNQVIEKQKPDVIVAGSALLTPVVYLLGRVFRIPVVINIHGLDLLYDNFFYQRMIRTLLPRCNLMCANSRQTGQLAVNQGVAPEKICVSHPGLDFSEFANPPQLEVLESKYALKDRRIILSAGRLASRKGIPEFIQHVLPRVVARFPDSLFLIVGENPTQSLLHKEDVKARIQTQIANEHLADHVRLLGHVSREELIQLYFACDLFVLPALETQGDIEGFGIVLSEASAAGKPVVATRSGGIPDAVVDGESGILTEPGDWARMEEVIGQLLTTPDLCVELGQFGRERARNELDWPIIGNRYHDLLTALVADSK